MRTLRRSPSTEGRPPGRGLAVAAAVAAVVAAAAVARLPADAAQAGPGPRPNVVVIMTDDQTVDSLDAMPKVERFLAEEGTTFNESFASYPLCCPSRATYLTGQYAHNHDVVSNGPPRGGYDRLDHSETLPVWLRRAGYRTAHVGKYLNGYGSDDPTEIPPGYDEWYGALHRASAMFDYRLNENGDLVRYGEDASDYKTDVLAAKAVDFIRRSADRPEPFFLTLAPSAPHHENIDSEHNPRPAPRHRGAFDGEPLPKPPSFNEQDVSDKPGFVQGKDRLGPAEVRRLKTRYRSRLESLLAVDDAVKQVIEALQEKGALSSTLVVYTSDNGYMHGEHRLKLEKKVLYEESTGVPLILRGPGVPSSAEREQLTANVDLAPTVLDVAGAEAGLEIDGRSLVGLAANGNAGTGRDILFERLEGKNQDFRAIRTPRYVYARHASGEEELYDLVKDPFQLESRHESKGYAQTREGLAESLTKLRRCSGDACR